MIFHSPYEVDVNLRLFSLPNCIDIDYIGLIIFSAEGSSDRLPDLLNQSIQCFSVISLNIDLEVLQLSDPTLCVILPLPSGHLPERTQTTN